MRDRLIEQVEQVPFRLADATTDGREFYGPSLSAEVAFCLVAADDTPAQSGLHQPPVKCRPVDRGAPGFFVVMKEILDTAQTTGREVQRCAEPPGPDAEPGQVFVDLTDVHQLPIQHG